MEVFLSNEPGYQSEGINLLTLEFDGSNSFVRRLFFSPDFVQAIRAENQGILATDLSWFDVQEY